MVHTWTERQDWVDQVAGMGNDRASDFVTSDERSTSNVPCRQLNKCHTLHFHPCDLVHYFLV